MILLMAFIGVIAFMTLLWIISISIKNVSIVDIFWGLGFVLVNSVYFFSSDEKLTRNLLVFILVGVWGLRLSIYLFIRNYGKSEDFRYQEFRRKYGYKNYWWISYFQVFLLQGVLIMIISMPLLGVKNGTLDNEINTLDYLAIAVWVIGFLFESIGDYQLTKFKSNPFNKGKVLNSGLWRYTRHPNYFGDALVWWSFGMFSISSGAYWNILGSIVMTFLIVKISGVSLLEKSLKNQKPDYHEYITKTSSFIPWPPKK